MRWFGRTREPGLEEGPEVLAGGRLRRGDELPGRAVAVPVLGRPRLEQPEERRITDRPAQRLQGQRAALVGAGPEQVRRAGIEGRLGPVVTVVRAVEARLDALPPLVFQPQPFRRRRETLVEPDVLPALQRDSACQPLVAEFVLAHHALLGAADERD